MQGAQLHAPVDLVAEHNEGEVVGVTRSRLSNIWLEAQGYSGSGAGGAPVSKIRRASC